MNQNDLIDQVYALTQAIEHAAALADWPEASRLTEQRSPLLMSIGAQQSPAALDLIRRIQATDAAILSDARSARSELQLEFGAELGKVKSVGAYHQIARL